MANKLIYIVILFIFTFTGFVLTGCEENKGLYVGFEVSSGCLPSPSDYSAYASKVSEFDINDVTLEFYYGGIFSENIELELENGRNIGKARLYFFVPEFCNNSNCRTQFDYEYGGKKCVNILCDDSRFFIKEGEEDYTSEAHRWKGLLYKKGEGEIITIPKELFINERGKIGFMVFVKDKNHLYYPNNEYEYISGKTIHYKVKGDRVELSGEPIK